jgi:hypothetical protein
MIRKYMGIIVISQDMKNRNGSIAVNTTRIAPSTTRIRPMKARTRVSMAFHEQRTHGERTAM